MKTTCRNPSCQRRFTANRFNRHHHLYCGLPECLRYRDRVRKRRSRQNHPPDAEFRAQEVKRIQEYRKRKRKTALSSSPEYQIETLPAASRPLSPNLTALVEEQALILTGLAVQLGGFSDRKSVTDFLGRCRKRGRELCVTEPDPP